MISATARAIVCLVTLGCCASQASAQAPAPPAGVRIQGDNAGKRAARAQIPQPPTPSVSLSVNQNDLYLNEAVTVTLNPIDEVRVSPFLFAVNFGDGEEIRLVQTAQVQHQYKAAGPYTISASVSVPSGAEIFSPMPVVANTVAVNVRTLTLSATPGIAAVGENVVFATPIRPGDARIRYRFSFTADEATDWISEPQTTHSYSRAGTSDPSLEVGLFDDNEYRTLDKSAPIPLQVADVALEGPTSIQANETATFTVAFPAGDPALRYRVNFGDESTSEWSVSPTVTHAYVIAGTFRPVGEIGRASDTDVTRVAASMAAELFVAGRSLNRDIPGADGPRDVQKETDWLPYVAIAFVVLLTGYGAKQMLFAPKPTFALHHGQTDAQIDSNDGSVHVQLEVRLHPEIDAVQTTLTIPAGRLIAARKSEAV